MAYNNIPEDIDILDLLNVFSLWAQVDNMKMDAEEDVYIRKVIKAIANEIDKLHKENDVIIQQNKEIIQLLKERIYND